VCVLQLSLLFHFLSSFHLHQNEGYFRERDATVEFT
jgi:hypothetical protein